MYVNNQLLKRSVRIVQPDVFCINLFKIKNLNSKSTDQQINSMSLKIPIPHAYTVHIYWISQKLDNEKSEVYFIA